VDENVEITSRADKTLQRKNRAHIPNPLLATFSVSQETIEPFPTPRGLALLAALNVPGYFACN
jgi:hypothetical protein